MVVGEGVSLVVDCLVFLSSLSQVDTLHTVRLYQIMSRSQSLLFVSHMLVGVFGWSTF